MNEPADTPGLDNRPHFKKVRHFISIFPHRLIENEGRDKFPIGETPTGRVATYNPDYKCPALSCYIEVATSKPNISEQGWKWAKALRTGAPLRIYWWEGNDITENFRF